MLEAHETITEIFGSNVFSQAVMRERLPKEVFKKLKNTIELGDELDPTIADVVANAMKDWAIEKGATHFCHWFQPMTGVTAEKHDSFISPTADGKTIMEFSGKELIQGEPDASSFPSGGLRPTFEARGYTAWDCTSPVFIKQNGNNITLYIPCAFVSYNCEALDKKTPLLRSMDVLDRQAMRVLKAMGNKTSKRVIATLGPEQEYFLIDKKFFEERLDLVLSGRTLFGAPPAKGQEMDDHYFGVLHERIASFMNELNIELWKLGVSAKTQHNEVSPAQYELAPVFATVNVGTDHNQLVMETMRKVAQRHDLVCLLHEKPFAGVNGSGKHNNWSVVTDDGDNLLDPGDTPHDNAVFLVFLMSIISAVDRYSKILRASVATAGNDHRLGANEAPPAIVSVFLGDQLTDIVEQLSKGGAKTSKTSGEMKLGVNTLPALPKDCTDRNRTSPFAFTGNKFEFRMVGSSLSMSGPNFVLNTIIAKVLGEVADQLEKEKAKDVNAAAQKIVQKFAKDHMNIVFNGDNYDAAWEKEAEKRGLPNIKNSVDALDIVVEKETLDMFEKAGVLSHQELEARHEILLEQYSMTINIEAMAMLTIAKTQILPAAIEYAGALANTANSVSAAGVKEGVYKSELEEVTGLVEKFTKAIAKVESAQKKAADIEDAKKQAVAYRDKVFAACNELRAIGDALEMKVDKELWPLPSYAEMLFLK